MAISIDYSTFTINVPKAETQFVEINPLTGLEVRQLNIVNFGQSLANIQDNASDVWGPTAYEFTQPADVGGTLLAPVLLILSPYTVTFEDDQYAVNLVGGNTNLPDFTNVNQVSIRPNNSAGQTFSKQAEDSAFGDNRVWIDTINGLPGTGYPRGTTGDPVNNLADAQTIITSRGLPKRLNLFGPLNTLPSDDLSEYNIKGASAKLAELNLGIGTNTNNLVVSTLGVSGDLNGNVTAFESTSFNDIDDFDGSMRLCGLEGTIKLGSVVTNHLFVDCYSEVAGSSTPIIDCNNIPTLSAQFRRYSGGLRFINFIDGNISVDAVGSIFIDSSCTGGTIIIRGQGTVVDNSGPNCFVIRDGFSNGLLEDTQVKIDEIHKLQGLDTATPMVITKTQRTAGTINLDLGGDGENITTVTRND